MAGQSRSLLADLTGATKQDILKLAEAHGVRFLRLTFTDILGVNKNVEIPSSQFSKALDGDIMFDGSSIEGFVRIEESDMLSVAGPLDVQGLPGRRPAEPGGPPDLRHHDARRARRSTATRGPCCAARSFARRSSDTR